MLRRFRPSYLSWSPGASQPPTLRLAALRERTLYARPPPFHPRRRDTFKRVWGFMCEHDARSLERSRGIQQQHKIQAKYFSTPPAKGQPQWVTKDIPLRCACCGPVPPTRPRPRGLAAHVAVTSRRDPCTHRLPISFPLLARSTHAHMVSRSHGESSLASSQALSSTISSHSSRMQELQDEHRNPFLANTNRVRAARGTVIRH